MVFLLKILCNLLERGKRFSIKFKNIFATLVDTSKLNGGLNQMILRCRFLLTLFCSWLGGVYVSFVVCPHFFSAFSYFNLVLLNLSALEEFRDNLSLIIFTTITDSSCRERERARGRKRERKRGRGRGRGRERETNIDLPGKNNYKQKKGKKRAVTSYM